jgi:hypothetical protein
MSLPMASRTFRCNWSPRQPDVIIDEVYEKLDGFTYAKSPTPVESWRRIFRLIFPSDERIPSPFQEDYIAQTDIVDQFQWVKTRFGPEILESVVVELKEEGLFVGNQDDMNISAILRRGFDEAFSVIKAITDPAISSTPVPQGQDTTLYRLQRWRKTQRGKRNTSPGRCVVDPAGTQN